MHKTKDGGSSKPAAPGITGAGLSWGAGRPLPDPVRFFFEPRFGRDFRDLRIHSDAKAAESARSVGARAYTLGKDIVFAQDEYQPYTRSGRRLLAHEMTHVVQQSDGGVSSPDFIQRAVRINNGARRVNEAEYQAGGARSGVGSRYRVSSLIADSVRRTFVDVAELEQYASGQVDNIGDVTTASAGVYWYRLPDNLVTVLGEMHQNPRGNVEDVIVGLRTSRFMYEPFNEITQVGGLSPQFSSTQGRLSQLNRQYRVSSLVDRRRFNPDLENIVIKAVTGTQVFRNEFLPADPPNMSAGDRRVWGRRASTSAYSYGERVALYLTTGIHIARDLAQRPAGPPMADEADLVQSGDALAAFYRANQRELDGIMQAKDRDDLIGIYELTAPNNFRVLPVLNTFAVRMHAYAAKYIQRLGAQTGNVALSSGGQALERNPGATLTSLSPVREEIMWNRIRQAISGGYLIVGMGDAHRQSLAHRLNAAGIPHEEVEASLRRQQAAVTSSWRP
ncbi:MAG: eCIS core domain-containing protein [Gammaproteobacteria bacterium]